VVWQPDTTPNRSRRSQHFVVPVRGLGNSRIVAGHITKQLQREHRAVAMTLLEFRQRAGLTQEALAERLGWHLMTVQRCENGQRRVAVEELIPLTAALGSTPERFVRAVMRRL
jgi:plasmid maintenance system antidote protein VapI